MEQPSGQPPAWKRKRTEKRRTVSARRVEIHTAGLRSQAAATGRQSEVAAAEFNVLRAAINRLPDTVRDGEFAQLAVVLKQMSTALAARHSK